MDGQTGFRRVSKKENLKAWKARRYITPDGKEISRSDYIKITSGGLSPHEKAKIRKNSRVPNKMSAYTKMVHAYKEKTAAKLGIKKSQVKVRGDSEQAKKFREVMKKIKNATAAQKADKSPDSYISKLLIEINFRNAEWDMPRGESPKT